MYETRSEDLLPREQFILRVFRHIGLAVLAAVVALALGILGYRYIAGMSWVDSLLNASMILGGMGPVSELRTDGAKVFASIYALFSGLFFVGLLGVLLAPFIHRIMHKLHMEESDTD